MRALRAVLAALLLLGALSVYFNSDKVDDWASNQAIGGDDEGLSLLGIQTEEKWLVLQVEFPNSPFSSSMASNLLIGDGSAEEYIDQMTAGESTLSVTLFDEVWQAPHGVKKWGEDVADERDHGADGNGAETLMREVAEDQLQNEDLSSWDLNGDGVIDRILILHSAQPQEKNGGANSLWSHFTGMQEPLEIGDWTFEHFTIASVHSGLGTVVHEMLHQMGALDLYDVHSDLPTSNWNGIGDWGIMASGNWNGNGAMPAMPSSSTMDLIGVDRGILITQNIDSTHNITGITNGGSYLEVPIAPNEWVRFTLRVDSGFDSALPGHGVLVEIQDRNNGDESNNLVNTDPDTAWLKIIEADGDAALERGRDSGDPADAFAEGSQLGANGMEIRDSRGRLVQWAATIVSMNSESATISFDFPESPTSVEVLPPRGPLEILGLESVYATVVAENPCQLNVDVYTSSNSDGVAPSVISIEEGVSTIELVSPSQMGQSSGYLRGSVGCEGEETWHIDLDWYSIGHRITSEHLTAIIPWDENSQVTLSTSCSGEGSRSYSIAVEGALSRIASVPTQGELQSCPNIVLDIAPDGLLTPGMIAEGELVFVDSFGLEQRVPVTLTAQSSFNGDSPLSWLVQPSNAIMLILILLAISLVTGSTPKPKTENSPVKDEDEFRIF
ncbi:MAG: immune inhibitor A [Candidatus Poseidoniales archaeon]|nr:immune inhibitor A [Candidatus Poseidoniales archaeon]|tara:strand:- start:6154 stop:8163 length:2010 start_codon:yes stop_codon:yes gene_type:complete